MISSNVIITKNDMVGIIEHIKRVRAGVIQRKEELVKRLPRVSISINKKQYELIVDPLDELLSPFCCVLSIILINELQCSDAIFEAMNVLCEIKNLKCVMLFVQLKSNSNCVDYGIHLKGLCQLCQQLLASDLKFCFKDLSCEQLVQNIPSLSSSPLLIHICFYGIDGSTYERTTLYIDGYLVLPRMKNLKIKIELNVRFLLKLKEFLECDIRTDILSEVSTKIVNANPVFRIYTLEMRKMEKSRGIRHFIFSFQGIIQRLLQFEPSDEPQFARAERPSKRKRIDNAAESKLGTPIEEIVLS